MSTNSAHTSVVCVCHLELAYQNLDSMLIHKIHNLCYAFCPRLGHSLCLLHLNPLRLCLIFRYNNNKSNSAFFLETPMLIRVRVSFSMFSFNCDCLFSLLLSLNRLISVRKWNLPKKIDDKKDNNNNNNKIVR